MCDCSIHCTWLKYFTELVEEINCIDCIKVNLKKSNNIGKHFDLYCEKCKRIKEEKLQNERKMFERKMFERNMLNLLSKVWSIWYTNIIIPYFFIFSFSKRMCDCSIHCTWLKYFTELVEMYSCIDCIKTNMKYSNKCVKHFDLYCGKCSM